MQPEAPVSLTANACRNNTRSLTHREPLNVPGRGLKTARDPLSLFPFNLGHLGTELALKTSWWKDEGDK
jgi:hypothetical protein